jgi:hypothetical protein
MRNRLLAPQETQLQAQHQKIELLGFLVVVHQF